MKQIVCASACSWPARTGKENILRLRLRKEENFARSARVTAAAVAGAFLMGSTLFLYCGVNPFSAFQAMLSAAFGSWYGISESLVRMIPLGLCALGVAVAAKMGLWNIGAEGQFLVGALASSWVALSLSLPEWAYLPVMAAAACLGGALWASIASVLRVRLGVSEILSTLMLNYVAQAWVEFQVYGPWKGPDGFPYTVYFPKGAGLSGWFGTRLHSGLIVLLVAAFGLAMLVKRTRLGFEIRLTGDSPAASDYAGVPSGKNIIMVMALSGALAGLAGMLEVSAMYHRLQPAVSGGVGYTAIIVAWLARCNMPACVVVALFFGGLVVAGEELQMASGVPQGAVAILSALIFICMLGAEVFERYELEWGDN